MTPDQVKSIRTKYQLSQRELADRLNQINPNLRTTATSISRWENGTRSPNLHAVAALKRVTGETEMPTLSETLYSAAALAERDAAEAIKDGQPENAEITLRVAAHIRRLAYNHRAASQYQDDPTLDPPQVD